MTIVYYPANLNSKVVAGARIARWIAQQIPGSRLIDSASLYMLDGEDLSHETCFVVNVPKTMYGDVPRSEKLIAAAGVLVYVQNDYSIWAPTPETSGLSIVTVSFTTRIGAKKPTFVWSTIAGRCEKHPTMYEYVNWNALAYQQLEFDLAGRVENRVLYFGAFRDGREAEFDKYMTDHTHLFDISAPKSAMGKFRDRYPLTDDQCYDILAIPAGIANWTATLYLEDDLSHRQYHSPANRFYEALSANAVVLVDDAALGTLLTAGFHVPQSSIVTHGGDLEVALRRIPEIRAEQTAAQWHLDPVTKQPHDEALRSRFSLLRQRLPAV